MIHALHKTSINNRFDSALISPFRKDRAGCHLIVNESLTVIASCAPWRRRRPRLSGLLAPDSKMWGLVLRGLRPLAGWPGARSGPAVRGLTRLTKKTVSSFFSGTRLSFGATWEPSKVKQKKSLPPLFRAQMHFEVIPAKALSALIHSTPLVQSRNFNKLWNLGQTSSWFCLAIHRTTLTNPSNNLNKSMQQFRQIHVTNKRNPCIDSDQYMWQLWQSKIQNDEGFNDLLWFCCISFYSFPNSTLFDHTWWLPF